VSLSTVYIVDIKNQFLIKKFKPRSTPARLDLSPLLLPSSSPHWKEGGRHRGSPSPSPRQKEGGRRRHHANRREADVVTAPKGCRRRALGTARRSRPSPSLPTHPLVVMESSRKEEAARRRRRGSSLRKEEGGGCMLSSSWKQRRGRRMLHAVIVVEAASWKEEDCWRGRQRGEQRGDGQPMVVEGRRGLRRGHLL
jgi:hypothetical protein